MFRTTRILFFVTLVAAFGPVTASATTDFDGDVQGGQAIETTPVVSSGDNYVVHLNAGDTLTATATWGDSMTDLDVFVIAPGGSCVVYNLANPPGTDAPCLANAVINTGTTCNPATHTGQHFAFGPSSEAQTVTAAVTGDYTVVVAINAGVPMQPHFYHLSLDDHGSGSAASAHLGAATNWIRRDVVCRARLTLGI